MSDTDRRRKMISLRLSEVEYEVLKTHYRTYGARNISELARLALQHIMAGSPGLTGSPGPQHNFATQLAALDERVHALEASVSLLLEREKVMS